MRMSGRSSCDKKSLVTVTRDAGEGGGEKRTIGGRRTPGTVPIHITTHASSGTGDQNMVE